MSAVCIVNLKEHKLSFDQLNDLANKLVALSLQKQKAVFFHSRDYRYDLIQESEMQNYFLMSDSFLYKNCEFLEEPLYCLIKDNIFETRKAFYKQYQFFSDVIKTIFDYDISFIEIYISADGSVGSIKDFYTIKSCRDEFLEDLFLSVFDSKQEILNEFPTVKFEIKK